jgi:hypothetical protein
MITLPRQARDKYEGKTSHKRGVFSRQVCGVFGSLFAFKSMKAKKEVRTVPTHIETRAHVIRSHTLYTQLSISRCSAVEPMAYNSAVSAAAAAFRWLGWVTRALIQSTPVRHTHTHTHKTKQNRNDTKTKANCETQKELTGFAPACPEPVLAKSFIAVRVVRLSRACLGKLYSLLNKGALLLCCASNSRRRGCYKPRWGGGRLRPRGCATSTMITHFTAFLKRNAPALQLFIRIMMVCN